MKTLLVITYLALSNGEISVRKYEMPDMQTCTAKGKQVSENVKAGRVSTVCWRTK